MEDVFKLLIGWAVPALGGYLWGQFRAYKARKQEAADENALIKKGLQSLLRYEMLQAYHDHIAMGYATPDDKGSFEAMHTSYAGLGENGVMNKIYADFMALPIEEQK